MPHMRQTSVLLIDGFGDEADMYAEYLNACGYQATVCRCSSEAPSLVRRQQPDVVIARLRQTGGISGIEVVRRLRAEEPQARRVIVMITASLLPEDTHAALAAGCDACLLLPVLPDVLAGELQRLLGSARRGC